MMASTKFRDPEAETVAMDSLVAAAVVEVTDIGDVADTEVTDVDVDEVMLVVELVVDVAQTNPKLLPPTFIPSPRRLYSGFPLLGGSPYLFCGINGELVCYSIACVMMARPGLHA